jgi:hypothetical protein
MSYKDLEEHVEARIRLEQDLKERLKTVIAAVASELRAYLAFPTSANGNVEDTGHGVVVVASFQLRRDEKSKKGIHSLRCEVQVVEEAGRIVAYVERNSKAFDVETAAGRETLFAEVDAAFRTLADAEKWLEGPPSATKAARPHDTALQEP